MIVRSAILNVMTRAAEKAGRALVRDFGEVENLQVSRKGVTDFVSAADRRAEAIVRESLAKSRPDYGFLLEEGGIVPGKDPDHRFIVDPLDGTTNFLHGLPHFAISIALEQRGKVTVGIVLDPVKDELFWAERGKGAWVNNRRLRVSARRKLAESVLATGIPHLGRNEGEGHRVFLQQMARMMAKVAGVRRWGAAALDLAYVAAGRYDGFWERGLSPWDVAAGGLLVREAGGFVTDLQGRSHKLDAPDIVAGNSEIHKSLLTTLCNIT